MDAVQYAQRVTSLIQELTDVYNQALGLCRVLDLNLPGIQMITIYEEPTWKMMKSMGGEMIRVYNPRVRKETRVANFPEQMVYIKIFLKALDGNVEDAEDLFTEEEYDIYEEIEGNGDLSWREIAKRMESYIEWLNKALTQCDNMLQIQYQPGGVMFQQAQERNVGKYGIGF